MNDLSSFAALASTILYCLIQTDVHEQLAYGCTR